MTNIKFSFGTPRPLGSLAPITGYLEFVPVHARNVTTVPENLILPIPFTEAVQTDGTLTVDLPATPDEWVWKITARITGVDPYTEYVRVPESTETLDGDKLYRVNESSLNVNAIPEPVWWDAARRTVRNVALASDGETIIGTRADGSSFVVGSIPEGRRGFTGKTPNLAFTATDLPEGSEPTVTVTGTTDNPVIHLGVPQGTKGDKGDMGVTNGAALTMTAGFLNRQMVDPTKGKAPRATLLTIPTYEGSGVATHPSVYFNASGWNGYRYWMGMTPYPNANSALENPSILVSHDGTTWKVPPGLTNPIDPDPGAPLYNSDINLVVDTAGVMHAFWRQTGDGSDRIMHKQSSDGVTWSAQVESHADVSTVRRLVSPAVIQLLDGSWVMYAVDIVPNPRKVLRYKASSPTGPWGAPETVALTNTAAVPWHIDVKMVGGEWHMLMQAGGPGGGDLVAAVSQDGLSFRGSGGVALVPKGNAGEWDSTYYKSSFVPTVKDGLFGWDLWVTSPAWAGGTSTMGRTFARFDALQSELDALRAETSATVAAMDAKYLTPMALMGVSPGIAGDTFKRADNASLGNAPSGHTWIADAGAMRIIGNNAAPATDTNTRSVIDVGVSDYSLSVVLNADPETIQHWIVARFQDGTNYWRFGFGTGGSLILQKIIAGAATNVVNIPADGKAGDRIRLDVKGSTFTYYHNGVRLNSFTDTTFPTGTKVGIQSDKAAARFGTFLVSEVA